MKEHLKKQKPNHQNFVKAIRKRIEGYKGSFVVIRSISLVENVTTNTGGKHHATDPLRAS